ncbi:hypothetical protein ACFQ1S_21480, partial [Kibdelosporangium lantanae]
MSNIGGFLDSPQARDMILKLGGVSGIVDAFLATEMAFLGIFTTVYGIQVLLRMRTEETAARLAPVLAATGQSKTRVDQLERRWKELDRHRQL